MKKRIYYDLLIIFLLGLFPLLWFPDNTLLLGHDAGMTFEPISHLIDRLSVWTQRLGLGTDQSYGLLGAIVIIHSLEAFLVWIGFSLHMEQMIQFVFWFTLPGLAMYFLTHKIWPDKKYLPLIASVIYMINYFLIQAWFVAERTKFSIYVALPLVTYFALAYLNGKMSFKKSTILAGLTLGVLNAGGSFPLYGGLALMFLILFVYQNIIYLNKETLKRTIFFSLGIALIYFLLNAFWLFPYIYYVFGFYSRDLALAGGPAGALGWSEYLSKGSTFINLFRGQGIPEWYLNPYHAFASNFLTNPTLILISFAFPLLAYSSSFFTKERRDKYFIYFFIILSFFAIFFAAGPRSELGGIYNVIALHVPGFAIFRSNFYKFGYVMWFSYAVLIGFTIDVFISKLETFISSRKKKIASFFSIVAVLLFIIGYVLYHYPLLNGSFLDYSHEPGKELTTRISVPQYIFDFGKWSNQQDPTRRYLVVPEISNTGYIAYQWGFWSLASINSLLTWNSFIQNSFLVPENERFLINQMYSALLHEDIKSFTDFTEVFAIDGIVVHEDFDWKNTFWGTTDPGIYEKILDNNPKFKLVKTFGKWKVYDIQDRDRSLRVTANPKLNFLQGELKNIVSFPQFDSTSPLFISNTDPKNSDYFANQATDVFAAPECIQCNLKEEFFGFNYYNPKILPGSTLYPLVLWRENLIKKKSKDFSSLLNYELTISDRRIVEAKWMVDSKQKLEFLHNAIDGYYSSVLELKKLVSENWNVTGNEENRLARTINGHLIQQVTLLDSIFESALLDIEHRRVLSLTYDEILKIKKIADKKQWITEDITDKRYIFDLPKTGTYDIYSKKKSLSDPRADVVGSTISFADNPVVLKPISENNDWLYFGKVNFDTRQLRLAFKDSTLKNLLDNVRPQFPDGTTGFSQKNNAFSMNLDSRNKCFTYTANNLETFGTQYLVSFSYRNLTDRKDLGFYVSSIKDIIPRLHVRESFVPNSRAWATHTQVVIPNNNSMKINFCNGFVSIAEQSGVREREDLKFISPGQNIIEIQDITLNKISYPVIVFYQKQRNVEKKDYVIDFKKTSPVQYKVNVASANLPVTLVMREDYGKFWQLCIENKKCLSFDDKNHFVSAGFTNGWYFKDGLKGRLTIYYFPQKMYIAGAVLSVISLLVIIGGICWIRFRKR